MSTRLLFCDTEYAARPLSRMPTKLHCLAVAEGADMRSHWVDPGDPCPEDFSDATLCAWHAWAEVGSFIVAGWPVPANVIDVAAEYRVVTNTNNGPKMGLNAALRHFDFEPEYTDEAKQALQDLAGSGAELNEAQRAELLEYCRADVRATVKLWEAIQATKLPEPHERHRAAQARARGAYVRALGKAMLQGVPVDGAKVEQIREHKAAIVSTVLRFASERYPGVFRGETLDDNGLAAYLQSLDLLERWPRTAKTKKLKKDRETFKEAAQLRPEIGLLAQALATKSHLSKFKLTVDGDRNRTLPLPWVTLTGRANPNNVAFVLSGPRWFRGLVTPPPGYAIVDADFSQQEYLIGAWFAKDRDQIRRYIEGDVYLGFGVDSRLLPKDATKQSHPKERQTLKGAVLSIGFGVTEWGLQRRLKLTPARAKHMLALHRRTYRTFWTWSDLQLELAKDRGYMATRLGWIFRPGPGCKPNTVRNFMQQAHGAEVLRGSLIELDQAGYTVCAANHDNVLLLVPLEELDRAKHEVPALMTRAAQAVLGEGCPMRVGLDVVLPGETMLPADPDSHRLWQVVHKVLEAVSNEIQSRKNQGKRAACEGGRVPGYVGTYVPTSKEGLINNELEDPYQYLLI